MSRHAKAASVGVVTLGFGWQYYGLVAAGVTGILPVPCWLVAFVPLASSLAGESSHGAESTLGGVAGMVAAPLLLVLPALLACLTLRARQPRGASVVWDENEIVEWDGPWKRAAIPWSRAALTHLPWVVRLKRGGSRTCHAIQIADTSTGATITAWDEDPEAAPVARRRRCGKMQPLVDEMERRGVKPAHTLDWSRVVDPDRPRRTWVLVLGRLGYPLVIAGTIGSPDSTTPGYILGAIGAALLAIRALPVFHEFRATMRHLAKDAHGDRGRTAALRLKLRAVGFEAFARAMFVVLTVASTIAGGSVLHR